MSESILPEQHQLDDRLDDTQLDEVDDFIKPSDLINFASTITSPLSRSTSHSKASDASVQSAQSLSMQSPLEPKRPVSSPVIASPAQAYQHVISSPFHPKPRVMIYPDLNKPNDQSGHSNRFDLTAFQADYNLTMLKVDLLTQPFTSAKMQSAVTQSINQSINPSIRPLHTPQPDILMRTRSSNHSSLDNMHDMYSQPNSQSSSQRSSQSSTQSINYSLPQSDSSGRSMSCITHPRNYDYVPHNHVNPSVHNPSNYSSSSASKRASGYSTPVYNQLMKQSINQTSQSTIARIAQDYEDSNAGVTCHLPRFVYEEKLKSLLQAMETIDVRSPVAVRSAVTQPIRRSTSRPSTSSKARYSSRPGDPSVMPSNGQAPLLTTRKTKSPGSNTTTIQGQSMSSSDTDYASHSRARVDNILNAKRVKLLAMAAASH